MKKFENQALGDVSYRLASVCIVQLVFRYVV